MQMSCADLCAVHLQEYKDTNIVKINAPGDGGKRDEEDI